MNEEAKKSANEWNVMQLDFLIKYSEKTAEQLETGIDLLGKEAKAFIESFVTCLECLKSDYAFGGDLNGRKNDAD